GAILVIAMVIVPAATAHLVTNRHHTMILAAIGHGLASAWGGMYASVWLNCSTAGAMVVTGGLLYTLALVFAPQHGLFARRGTLKVVGGIA
ncbi:MAG: metal ABC transporter permease, partial [Myxococcota bacterium]